MKKSILVLVVFILVVLTAYSITGTYSRYATAVSGEGTATAAAWIIQVNEEDITSTKQTLANKIELNPIQDPEYVANGKMAPGYGGYFDIAINPTGTEVAFSYDVSLGAAENLPENLVFSKYDLNVGSYQVAGGEADATQMPADGHITGEVLLENGAAMTENKQVWIRIYWNWEDLNSETANADDVSHEGTAITIPVEVSLEQYFGN